MVPRSRSALIATLPAAALVTAVIAGFHATGVVLPHGPSTIHRRHSLTRPKRCRALGRQELDPFVPLGRDARGPRIIRRHARSRLPSLDAVAGLRRQRPQVVAVRFNGTPVAEPSPGGGAPPQLTVRR